MKCKYNKDNCITRVITRTWEEMRACEQGITCSYSDRRVLKV